MVEALHLGRDRAHVSSRFDDVPGSGLTLRADHGRPFPDPSQRLTEVRGSAHERHRVVPLVHVVALVCGGQDLGLVDVIDAERLQHLSLDEVADPTLGHDRDGDCVHDLADLVGVGHAHHAALGPDIGGDPLERHDRDRARILRDLRLSGRRDVHDHAALQHLCESTLDPEAPGVLRSVDHVFPLSQQRGSRKVK